jgi:hypothetical protein
MTRARCSEKFRELRKLVMFERLPTAATVDPPMAYRSRAIGMITYP